MRKRKFKERVIAWLLAVIMVIGGCVIPNQRMVSHAAEAEKSSAVSTASYNGGDSSEPNANGAGEPTEVAYIVSISPLPKLYPEEPVQLSADVVDAVSMKSVPNAMVTWSLEGNLPATITPDGKLTVQKGTSEGTKITVKATYTDESTSKKYEEISTSETSVRETEDVLFNVKDSYNQASITNATVILEQSTNLLNQKVTAVHIGNGQYRAKVYTGITYHVIVTAANYAQKDIANMTPSVDMAAQEIVLTTSHTADDIKITVPAGEIYAGDTVALLVEVPQEWQGEAVAWKTNKGKIDNGRLNFDGFGEVEVTASCHGVTSNPVTVSFKPVNDKTTVAVKVYSDEQYKTEIDEKHKVYPNEKVYVKAEVTYQDKAPTNGGEMTFTVEKQTKDGTWTEVKDSSQTVNVSGGVGTASVKIPADKFSTAGKYRVTAEYKGSGSDWDHTASASNQTVFEITPKEGQIVDFAENLPTEYVYNTSEIQVGFAGLMASSNPNTYDITVETEGGIIENAELKNVTVSDVPDSKNLYEVKGTVAFMLNNVGAAGIKICIKDNKDAEQQVYADAVAEYTFKVMPKPLTISAITFADKIYDGTSDVQLKSVSLNGIETADSGKVQVDIGDMQNGIGSKVFHLTGTDATEDGYPLSFDEAKDTKFVLNGESAGKYSLNITGYENYCAKVQKRLLGINPKGLSLVQAYWSNLYTKKDGESDDVYNMALNEAAFKARENLYTNIVESEKQEILNQLRDYHPKFKAEAYQWSFLGEYDIYAYNPVNKNELKNYKFDFEGGKTKAGILTIGKVDVEGNDFEVVGENVSQIDAKSFYVRSGSDAAASVISCVNTDGSVKYNDVVFLDNLKNTQYFNPSKEDAVWPETNGQIAFRLVKKDAGSMEVASSNPYIMDFISDGSVQSQITVEANNDTGTFDKVIHTLTFGLFGNEKNTTAKITYSDEQSGVKARYYAVVNYDEWKKNGNYENALKTFTDWKTVIADTPVDAVTEIGFEDGRQLVLSKVVDNVGNIQYVISNGIVVDSVKPNTITADIINPSSDNVYNKDVEIGVSVSDFIDDTTAYSGISSVDYKVEINHDNIISDDTKWETYTEEKNLYKKEKAPTEIETAEDLKEDEGIKAVGTITVSPDEKNENYSTEPGVKNRMRVTIWATDYAGNVTERTQIKTVEFDFDTTAPKLEISFDGDAVNDKYFNKERTATVKVTEAYFDSSRVKCDAGGADYIQPWMPVGDNIYEAKYVYNTDGDWTFDINMTDKAGNYSDMAASFGGEDKVPANYRAFTIDKTAPEIKEIHYYMYQGENVIEVTPGKAEAERLYGNARMYAVLTLEEHNFDGDDKTGSKDSGLELDITANNKGDSYTEPVHKFTKGNGDVHTLRVDFKGDANYIFDMQYTDLAGNTLAKDYVPEYFTVDTQKPSANISVLGKTWDKIVEVITFGLFSNENKTVEISNVFDRTAGVAAVQYYKSHDVMTVGQLDNAAWTDGSELILRPNQQAVVYGKITDKSGNYAYISTNGFVLDNMIDAPQIDIVMPKPLNEIYNSDVDAKIKVIDPDPTEKGDYAGLKSVYYEIRNNGAVTQSGNLNVQPGEARQQSVEDIIKINAQKNNSNNVQIYVKATDNAGNSAEKTLDLKIDITKPDITVTFDNSVPLNQKYYKDTRTATVVIRERNFDANNVQINVTNTHGTKARISGWSSSANAGVSDEATHTARIIFAADGDYKFTVDCTDLALNKAVNPYTSEEFTIDKTLPAINVSYDNNNALNGNFYKAGRTATITVKEHNFRAGDVKVTTTAALDGKGVSAPTVSGWVSSGDNHTATVRFNTDADYTLDIAYADLAGNAASDYAQDKFTVDLTKPEIEITGIKNKSANNGTVAPEIKVKDTNFIASGVKLSLTGVNKGKLSADTMVTKAALGSGQVITFRNFGKDMDDIYTLTATATDKSGNETKKSITFSVNRNGSTYVLSDGLKQLLETGFTNSPNDIVVEEVNVDTLEFIELTYSKDGKVVKLKEGTDYTVKSEGGSNQWKKYIYTIKASCFEEEGAYAINIYSEDRAKNTSTNRIKEKSIEFVVDKTPPTMVISNIEDRGRYKEDMHTFTLSVKDNTTLSYVELYLDGKLAHTYKGDELIAEDGTISIDVDSKGDYQTVRLIAYDEAGNPTEPMEYSVLVTSSWWIQFYMNTPLFIGSIVGLAAVFGLIIFIIVKRKKKNAQK